jgi:hypothetical protein
MMKLISIYAWQAIFGSVKMKITDEDLYPSKYNATYNCITQKNGIRIDNLSFIHSESFVKIHISFLLQIFSQILLSVPKCDWNLLYSYWTDSYHICVWSWFHVGTPFTNKAWGVYAHNIWFNYSETSYSYVEQLLSRMLTWSLFPYVILSTMFRLMSKKTCRLSEICTTILHIHFF